MESYAWIVVLATWLLLLLLGLAGGDPLAAGRPGQEAPVVALARWAQRLIAGRVRRRVAAPAGRERTKAAFTPWYNKLHAG